MIKKIIEIGKLLIIVWFLFSIFFLTLLEIGSLVLRLCIVQNIFPRCVALPLVAACGMSQYRTY